MQLTVPQFHSVTRSFTQKVNLKNYVEGHDYEMVDLFSSHSEAIPVEEANASTIKVLSDKLYSLAKADVEQGIKDYITRLQEPKEKDPIMTLTLAEELSGIADIVVELNKVTTQKELAVVKEMATTRKATMTKAQLECLAALFRKFDMAKLK